MKDATIIRYSDITTYITEINVIMNEHVLPTRVKQLERKFDKDENHIRQIDIESPEIIGTSVESVVRLDISKIVTDS